MPTPTNSKTVKIRCLDCRWKVDVRKPGYRSKAKIHATRKGHSVKLETVTTVIYSETPNYPRKVWSRAKAGLLLTLVLAITACTSTEPVERVCKEYSFSHDSGRDTVFIVSCDTNSTAVRQK